MLRRHPLFQEILARGERSGATIFWKHRDLTALPIHPVTVSLALRVGQIDGDNPHSYITHSGLLRLASRRRCEGIQVEMVRDFCEPTGARWAIRATVFPLTSPQVSSGLATQIPRMSRFWCTVPRCGWQKLGRSIAPSARPYGMGICPVEVF